MLLLWLVLAGCLMGSLAGKFAIGDGLANYGVGSVSFSALSANPASQQADQTADVPCDYCPDSYGVAAQMRAEHRRETGEPAFRALGAVSSDHDWPQTGAD